MHARKAMTVDLQVGCTGGVLHVLATNHNLAIFLLVLRAACPGKSPDKGLHVHVARGAGPSHTQDGTHQARESKREGQKERGEEGRAVREIVRW